MLTTPQKSIYLVIFNATMIFRSVGKTLGNKTKLKQFKQQTFRTIEQLSGKINSNTLTEKDIINSIEKILKKFNISFGQAQKAINVILKYHFFLTSKNKKIKKTLHCPIDSIILKELRIKNLSLAKIDKEKYLEMQKKIEEKSPNRIEFDLRWDKQHLKDEGLDGAWFERNKN